MRASPSAPVSRSGEEGKRATAASTTADWTGAAGEQGLAAPASRAAHTTPARATSAAKRWFIAEGSVREERLVSSKGNKTNKRLSKSSRISWCSNLENRQLHDAARGSHVRARS